MMRAAAVFLAALLAVSAVSGARVSTELLAPAPAPAANKPAADLLFTLSAANATFLAADRLELSSVQATAQAFNTETRATGIYSLGTFANTSAASPFASAWAGAPDALMYATANGSRIGALLAMSQPAFDVAAGKLTFAVRVLPADAAALALAGGATARAAGDAANGLGSTLVSEVPVGAALTSAALFIDLSSAQVGPAATTKDCWSCGGGGWNSGWGNSWGGGSWGNNGWDQSYQQPSQNTNINNNNVVQNQGWNNSPTNINNNNVQNNGNNGGNTNINNNNVAGNGNNGNNNINNNNVGNSGTNINNNNAGRK